MVRGIDNKLTERTNTKKIVGKRGVGGGAKRGFTAGEIKTGTMDLIDEKLTERIPGQQDAIVRAQAPKTLIKRG